MPINAKHTERMYRTFHEHSPSQSSTDLAETVDIQETQHFHSDYRNNQLQS